jgi:large subunit ribosomal protein L21
MIRSIGTTRAHLEMALRLLYTNILVHKLRRIRVSWREIQRLSMHAIIETGGKQYRVAPGDVIRVETLEGEIGSEIALPLRAVFKEEGQLVAGADLGEATLKGTIVGNGRAKKILVFKFKRKKQYKRTIGHRQNFTEVKVGDILV